MGFAMRWLVIPFVVMSVSVAADAPPIPRDTLPATLDLAAIPLGLGERPECKDNALTDARVQLGRKLFFDPILSADNTVACASCHRPEHGFANGNPVGIGGQKIARRAPTLLNRAFGKVFFWDGRAATLEEQALLPIADPAEMGSNVADTVKKLSSHAEYKKQFEAAFDDGVSAGNLAKALAGFERVLLRGDSPIDKFRTNGDHKALTPEERHGLWLYESKAQCWRCHSGRNFTDEEFHNTGVSWGQGRIDLGRFAITKDDADRGKFKTPTLRGVALSAPYMHDGSFKTLEDVVEYYSRGGNDNPHRDSKLQPLSLTKEEMASLVAFLKAL
jgi:cytochrome c peroxidase